MRQHLLLTACLVCLFIAFPVYASPSDSLSFESTQENISIEMDCSFFGLDSFRDLDSNKVFFRIAGTAGWRETHPLARCLKMIMIDNFVLTYRLDRLSGSVFNLLPDTAYDIRMVLYFNGTDTLQLEGSVRTQTPFKTPHGRNIYVNAGTGDDAYSGLSAGQAKASINAAVQMGLGPGDVVHIANGEYFEEVVLDSLQGEPGNGILFLGEGDSVFIEGCDSAFLHPSWQAAGADSSGNPVYFAPYGTEPDAGYLDTDAESPLNGKMYQYHLTNVRFGRTLDDFYADLSGINYLGTFCYNDSAGGLYMALPPGQAPGSLRTCFSSRKSCVRARYSSHLGFRNLNIQHGGYYGLSLEGCNFIQVSGCRFRYHKTGICSNTGILNFGEQTVFYFNGTDTIYYTHLGYPEVLDSQLTNHCVVESCLFTCPKVWEWNMAGKWGFMHDNEFTVARHHINGVDASYAGTGWIIRHCVFTDLFNGLYFSQNSIRAENMRDRRFFRNFDFHDNTMTYIADDCLEPEGAAVNLRMYRNRLRYFRNGFSDSPTTVGPVFFFRNVLSNWLEGAIKAKDAWYVDDGVAYHYHNTFFIGNDRNSQGRPVISATADYNDYYINNIMAGGISVYSGAEGVDMADIAAMDYNSYYTVNGDAYLVFDDGTLRTLADARAHGFEDHGYFNTDRRAPLFEGFDGDLADFNLRAGAVEVDKGVRIPGINDGFLGEAPDIGAFEFDPSIAAEIGPAGPAGPYCAAAPNPFNAGVTFSLFHPARGRLPVSFKIFDTGGRLVLARTLKGAPDKPLRVRWNAHDRAGKPSASGVYVVEWTIPGKRTLVQKAILIR